MNKKTSKYLNIGKKSVKGKLVKPKKFEDKVEYSVKFTFKKSGLSRDLLLVYLNHIMEEIGKNMRKGSEFKSVKIKKVC
jgi:hypothetical protein